MFSKVWFCSVLFYSVGRSVVVISLFSRLLLLLAISLCLCCVEQHCYVSQIYRYCSSPPIDKLSCVHHHTFTTTTTRNVRLLPSLGCYSACWLSSAVVSETKANPKLYQHHQQQQREQKKTLFHPELYNTYNLHTWLANRSLFVGEGQDVTCRHFLLLPHITRRHYIYIYIYIFSGT